MDADGDIHHRCATGGPATGRIPHEQAFARGCGASEAPRSPLPMPSQGDLFERSFAREVIETPVTDEMSEFVTTTASDVL